jgi:catechol 2,3-dioxygenase-like lactoylglutathione lyase family enzyme
MGAAEVRRFLHCNYNCRNLEQLDQFYRSLFSLKNVMHSTTDATEGYPFGMHRPTVSTDTIFLYDHRGPRVCTSLELVKYVDPPPLGYPYREPYFHGIQSCAYVATDIEAIATEAVRLGGSVTARTDGALRLRDPEGVHVEVLQGERPKPEAHHLRIVCSDLGRTRAWYERIGFTVNPEAVTIPGEALWSADDRQITGEVALSATDERTFSLIFNTWSGGHPGWPTYAGFNHVGLYRMAIAVDDVHAAYEDLQTDGVAGPPPYTFPLPGTKITDGLTILFIRDPDGIMVELVERPRSIFQPRPG